MSAGQNTASAHTEKFAGIVCAKGYESLDMDAITTVKRLILDGVAVAVAGTAEDAPKIYAAHARDTCGAPQATLWGFGSKVPASAAAPRGKRFTRLRQSVRRSSSRVNIST